MTQQPTQPEKIYLSLPEIPLEKATSSSDIRCTFTNVLKTLLQRPGNSITQDSQHQPNIKSFLESLKNTDQTYKASMSRQLATDLPPDAEQTSLKDEPKDWFIKTADWGDDSDRILQHRDGEITQLLEDLATYSQLLQENYTKIVLLRPPTYTGYDTQLAAAMQCLGYTKEQFQFIIVQPLKLYAFHNPSQQVRPLPDIHPQELLKAVNIDALRWHSLRVPLTEIAPLNLSTAGKPKSNDTFDRVQSTYKRCSALVQQSKELGITETNAPESLEKLTWESADAATLASLIQATPKVLQQSSNELAPHLICRHLEMISQVCSQWFEALRLTPQTYLLLLNIKETMLELLEILNITT